MPTSPIVIGLISLTLGIALFALLKGGPAERLGGAMVGANLLLSVFVGSFLPPSVETLFRLTLDGLTALGLLIIAFRYASFWLGGAMLLYAAQFSLHAFYMVMSRPVDLLHMRINNLNFLGISVCLAVGSIVGWRRRVVSRRSAA